MKKLLVPLLAAVAALLTLMPLSALADEIDRQPLTGITVSVNNLTPDAPYMVHNDIIYMPMDKYHCTLLGASVSFRGDGAVNVSPNRSPINYPYVDQDFYTDAAAPEAPSVIDKPVYLNGIAMRSDPYHPFVQCGETVYFPLTWDNAAAMGWIIFTDNTQPNTTFYLYSDNSFCVSSYDPDNPRRSYSAYCIISGTNCVMLENEYSRFFSSQYLSFGKNGVLTEYKNPFFDYGWSPDGMTLSGDTLTIAGGYYYTKETYGHIRNEDSPHESYILTIDTASRQITDYRLTDKTVGNQYGITEAADGSFKDKLSEGVQFSGNHYGFMDGSHVILNGNMMPSYSMFMYVASSTKSSDGHPMYISGSPRSYWIRVEDLENYGYDMRVDFDGRATYFTRNPEKAIAPMSLTGTNEHLPVYDSDWKIYIDGIEPKLYFNIGGYTLMYAGDLGEAVRDTLADGYDVLLVTTPDLIPPQKKIVGYYSVDVFDEPVENLQLQYLTDVMYAFVINHADGTLTVPKPDTLRALVERAHAAGVKVHASIGGWSTPNENLLGNFVAVASDPELTRKFIESCVWMVREYGLDGIELDWEHPDANTSGLYETFALRLCGESRLPSVSAALCGCSIGGTPIYAAEAVSDKVMHALDFINIMAYDGDNGEYHSPYAFAESSLKYWLDRGADKNKLILGIPLYAHPSYKQYRHLAAEGYDVIKSDFADTKPLASYYNSLETIKKKTALAKETAGGVMFFDIHEDTADDTSAAKAAFEILMRQ